MGTFAAPVLLQSSIVVRRVKALVTAGQANDRELKSEN